MKTYTGDEIYKEILEYSDANEKHMLSDVNFIIFQEVIDFLSDVCFCPECGAMMVCYSHFCESCKERIVQPIEGDLFAKYIAKSLRKGNLIW